jgi:hypothetical protein
MSPQSLASKNQLCFLTASRWLLAWLQPWRWRRHILPKRRLTFSRLHGVISQKIQLFITISVRTANPAHEGRGLISLWLYKENKLRDGKNVFTVHIPPWAPYTYGFVVLTSLTHPREILLVALQIRKQKMGEAKDLSAPLRNLYTLRRTNI